MEPLNEKSKEILEIVSGIPSGRTIIIYEHTKDTPSFGNLVREKLKLEKNKPV